MLKLKGSFLVCAPVCMYVRVAVSITNPGNVDKFSLFSLENTNFLQINTGSFLPIEEHLLHFSKFADCKSTKGEAAKRRKYNWI